MGMGQKLNKQWEWEWESIRMGMEMTPTQDLQLFWKATKIA